MALNYIFFSGEGTGLFRLHSTYRHDLKIYSSDEGRVQVRTPFTLILLKIIKHMCWKKKCLNWFAYVDQMSAAAFAKGMLDLEGQLTPILIFPS